MLNYGLDENKNPYQITVEEAMEWMDPRNFEKRRLVARTDFADGSHLSTVFLVFDHGFSDEGPVLFESMYFCKGDDDGMMKRYKTWKQAVKGHKDWVAEIGKEEA